MRIAIDVRKLNDFGIGTYIRHLIKYLPKIDQENQYFLFHRPEDRDTVHTLYPDSWLIPVLNACHARTGVPSLVNTSFNMHEEPIVASPDDAVRAFVQGHLDTLVLGPFLVDA